MAIPAARVTQLILEQLSCGDRRVLSLVVAVRKSSGGISGDLSAMVRAALRKLIASGTIVDHDGVYSLSSPNACAGEVETVDLS